MIENYSVQFFDRAGMPVLGDVTTQLNDLNNVAVNVTSGSGNEMFTLNKCCIRNVRFKRFPEGDVGVYFKSQDGMIVGLTFFEELPEEIKVLERVLSKMELTTH
jgi:hypothetical protein